MDDPSALDDPATRSLARALYWIHEPRGPREGASAGTREIRERMMGFAWRMRVDEGVVIPLGEPHLGAATPLKRKMKYLLFRLLRFMTARYERLLAEQTDLSVSLAERVIELEVQLEEMRDRIDRTDPNLRRRG